MSTVVETPSAPSFGPTKLTAPSHTIGDLVVQLESPVSVKAGDTSLSLASEDLNKEFNSGLRPGVEYTFRPLSSHDLVLDLSTHNSRDVITWPRTAGGINQHWSLEVLLCSPGYGIRTSWFGGDKFLSPGESFVPPPPVVADHYLFPWKVEPVYRGLHRVVRLLSPFGDGAITAGDKAGDRVTLQPVSPLSLNQLWVVSDA